MPAAAACRRCSATPGTASAPTYTTPSRSSIARSYADASDCRLSSTRGTLSDVTTESAAAVLGRNADPLRLQRLDAIGRVGELLTIDRLGAMEPLQGLLTPVGLEQEVGVGVAQPCDPRLAAHRTQRRRRQRPERAVDVTHVRPRARRDDLHLDLQVGGQLLHRRILRELEGALG